MILVRHQKTENIGKNMNNKDQGQEVSYENWNSTGSWTECHMCYTVKNVS